jgi:hypothetical protein
MHTENGILVDLDQIRRIVDNADVFTVAFRLFPERLLIDTRYDISDPDGPCRMPMVAIVDPVETVEERFFWLGQHRPTLGTPQAFNFLYWPHSIAWLQESGVWSAMSDRILRGGFDGAGETLDAAFRDLLERERQANIDAITGERHHTIWSAASA